MFLVNLINPCEGSSCVSQSFKTVGTLLLTVILSEGEMSIYTHVLA